MAQGTCELGAFLSYSLYVILRLHELTLRVPMLCLIIIIIIITSTTPAALATSKKAISEFRNATLTYLTVD